MKPSPFAKWVQKNYFKSDKLRILEIGCGNGRDTTYFAKQGHKSHGIDSSLQVPFLKLPPKNIFLWNMSIEEWSAFRLDKKKPFNITVPEGVIYMRFFLHSISESLETKILKWIKIKTKNSTMICIETRSDKDNPKTFYYQKHKRRLINGKKLIKKLLNLGYDIIYYQEARGLAKYKKEDPIIIRIIAKI